MGDGHALPQPKSPPHRARLNAADALTRPDVSNFSAENIDAPANCRALDRLNECQDENAAPRNIGRRLEEEPALRDGLLHVTKRRLAPRRDRSRIA